MTEAIRILVVDDSEDDRALYRRELRKGGVTHYDVDEAEDGDSALAMIDHTPFQCVLLDYSLPGRNGIEVLRRLRAKHPFMPVVMLTGQGNEAVAVAAMQAGAQNYIVKSTLTADEIDRAIQLAIAHCAMERRIEDQRLSLEIFTRALAHDLKEPVRTIKSFLAVLMAREPISDDGKRYFGYVHDAAERMAALIDAVYYYTRLDSSAQPLAKDQCELGPLVEEAKLDLAELIRERDATVTVGPLPQVLANALQMRQVFQNLISNAIQHCPHDPLIAISAEEHADSWVIRVADNGTGVELTQRDKIFEPFIRLAHHKTQGLGMGLAICKRVMETHGGRIWCEDQDNGGTAFLLKLPKGEQPVAEKRAPSPSPSHKAISPTPLPDDHPLARILLVDDNEAAIELTRIVLLEGAKLRCQFNFACGGDEALAMLSTAAEQGALADLVLLDINMPRMDGFELLRRMREDDRFRDVPVVMCTTSSYDKDMERAKTLGAAGFVTKPATIKNLKPVLSAVSSVKLSEIGGICALLRVA